MKKLFNLLFFTFILTTSVLAQSIPFPGPGGVGTGSPTATVWNSADKAASLTLSGGDLVVTRTSASGTVGAVRATTGRSSGLWYWEDIYTTLAADQDDGSWGLGSSSATLTGYIGSDVNGWGITKTGASSTTIQKAHNGSKTNLTSTATWTSGDVMMIAWNANTGNLWFGRNGTWFDSGDPAAGTNPIFTSVTGTLYPMTATARQNDVFTGNFGSTAFTYSAPSGFSAWTP